MRIRWLRILLPALALPLAACEGEGRVFIALDSDFADFRTWPRYALGDTPQENHSVGPHFGYLKAPAPTGAKAYPVGAMIVKTVEQGATAEEWDVFAMVKRGGGFNEDGARDWEFFVLLIGAHDTPVIVGRGSNPQVSDAPDGSTHYSDLLGLAITCNRCHGLHGTDATDHVLSTALAPGAL